MVNQNYKLKVGLQNSSMKYTVGNQYIPQIQMFQDVDGKSGRTVEYNLYCQWFDKMYEIDRQTDTEDEDVLLTVYISLRLAPDLASQINLHSDSNYLLNRLPSIIPSHH